jgi:hypothetical protein
MKLVTPVLLLALSPLAAPLAAEAQQARDAETCRLLEAALARMARG